MSAYVNRDTLVIRFAGGPERVWRLSEPSDKAALRLVLGQAIEFARLNGATIGQQNAVRKALTSAGYRLTK